jgi:hypothetical protein
LTTGRDDDAKGFASRWSRLKRRAAEPEPEKPANTPAGAPTAEEPSDAEVLEKLGLPDPETLKPGDDFAAFMASAVPAHLRNRALRRLWLSDPVLANLDALVDYGGDFTDKATVIEGLQTAYRVGRGMLDRAAGEEAEVATDAEATKTGEDGSAAESPADAPAAASGEPADTPPETASAAVWPAAPARSAPRRQPRQRMRFRMAED